MVKNFMPTQMSWILFKVYFKIAFSDSKVNNQYTNALILENTNMTVWTNYKESINFSKLEDFSGRWQLVESFNVGDEITSKLDRWLLDVLHFKILKTCKDLKLKHRLESVSKNLDLNGRSHTTP